uniref:Uncharacterized protein n=1 Tax=Strigamia maritima TaxID=126957 RepID=T1JLF2_STRMM
MRVFLNCFECFVSKPKFFKLLNKSEFDNDFQNGNTPNFSNKQRTIMTNGHIIVRCLFKPVILKGAEVQYLQCITSYLPIPLVE